MAETELKYIKNIGLFSKHYLQNILPKREIWKETDRAKPVFDKIKSLYNANRVFLSSSPNEAQLRDKFLNNVLEKLDHYYQVEGKVEKSAKHPDYGLFADKESSQEAIALQGKDDFYKKAIAICEAKSWEISLDKSVKGKPTFANQNPSFQVDAYLRETAPQWAILTNGRYWRLYYQETSYRLVNYFEIDLGEIIDKDCLEEFKYFYLLFRREAFIPDSQGVCFLDHVYNGSIAYAKELGENVQENVYKAMKTLAEGFISWTENKLSLTNDEKVNDEILREVQENTMKLLYRLLFIFYSEAGILLDIENRSYRDSYSLDSLKRKLRDQITGGYTISQYTSNHWTKLQDLFRLIDKGLKIPEENLFIPAYNGGLFDPKRSKFLKEKRVGDYFVAKAVDLLATSKGKDGSEKGFVDYSSLDIRHLGAIYEGLLEYKLKRAEEPMVAIKKSKKELWIPELEFKGKKYLERVDAGGLYLATDKGERKATGSYYTPDYIVKYIVKNAIGPVVEEKIKHAKKEGKSICDAILSVKILDPAMGSGHFLVEVVDFLTQPLLDAVNKDIERGIIEEKEVTAEWAKREIAAHCIYGVDLNPMAVELAKVSLWLKTIAKDKPLSFLDHRLKLGNSLIGANLSELRNYPDLKKKKKEIDKDQQQFEVVIPQIFIDRLLKKTREIESIRDETLMDTKRKEEIFAELKKTDAYIKTLAIANVNTAVYFGNEVGATSTKDKKGVYYQLINTLDFPKDWQWLSKKDWFIKAQKIAEEKRLFHWELEFPEVFFEKGKRKDNPGFDAVIGNPPYLQKESFNKTEKKLILEFYPENTSNVNLATVFMSKAQRLTRKGAFHSFIVPKSLLFTKAWENDRKRLIPNMHRLCDVSKAWKEVLLEQTIYVWQNSFKPITKLFLDICENESIRSGNLIKKGICDHLGTIPTELTPQTEDILNKCLRNGENLSKHAELPCGLPYQRMLKERGDVPAIGGNEIWRYEQLGIKGYFNMKDLENDKEFIKRIDVPHIVLQRIVAHILSPRNHIEVAGTVDTTNNIPVNTITCLFPKRDSKLSLYFLCGWLNSRFYSWYAYNFVFSKAIRSMDLYEYFAVKVPLPKIIFNTDIPHRKELFNTFTELYNEGDSTKSFNNALSFVSDQIENHTDVAHDILTFLAKRMIDMNKQKQVEINSFIEWLERDIGTKVDGLSNKTTLKKYHDNDFDTFATVLKKNKKKLSVDPGRREFQEKVKREFDASITKLNPLKEKIKKTDWLIDQIVHKLYGLTDEEIEIVEESFREKI